MRRGGIPSSVNRDNIGDFSEIKRKDKCAHTGEPKIYAWLYIREKPVKLSVTRM